MDRCKGSRCRSCKAAGLELILDLGSMPLSDRFLRPEQLTQPEPRFPLEVAFCPSCALVQIIETVPPETLFCDNYPYFSSFTTQLLRHSHENVMELIRTRRLGPDSLVIELASNDGYLLRNYVEHGIPVLGIDPAQGPARAAQDSGVPTMITFFTEELAGELVRSGSRADVVHANNVLAHVADTNGFVRGIAMVLKDSGVAVIEAPYVGDLVDGCEFDTIYHEHLCYFSLTALDALFRRHSLFLQDVRHLAIHGGSLRLYVGKENRIERSVAEMLEAERRKGLDRFDYFRDFSRRVLGVKESVSRLLGELRGRGRRIAGYGAAAKGTISINYIGIGPDVLEFVVDRNTHKQGLFMPGHHQPIHAPEKILDEMPDYVLILPWNFADEIMAQQEEYRKRGGKFIIPLPEPRIL